MNSCAYHRCPDPHAAAARALRCLRSGGVIDREVNNGR